MPDNTIEVNPPPPTAWTWNQAPRILATLILTGLGTLVVSGFFLCPQLDQGREEARCSYLPRLCRDALAEIESVPPHLRAEKWPIVGRIAPDLTVIALQPKGVTTSALRATLRGVDYQIERVFVARDTNAAVTDGRDDYTLEFMQDFLMKVKARRNREWIIMITVWITTWAFLAWNLLPRLPVTESKAIPQG